jgi:hypothetical protein
MSAEEVRLEHVAKMGRDLGAAFNAIHNEVAWLYLKWDQYRALFGTKPERIDLLNGVSPLFFHILQDVMWEDTLLSLSRLTDREEIGGKTNLTVRRLPALIADPQVKHEVLDAVETAIERSAFARQWRNRHIAHRDLALALKEPTKELPPASRLMVQQALESLAAILNRIRRHHLDGDFIYDFPGNPGDALSLMQTLRRGVHALRTKVARLEKGELLPEDYESEPPI